MLALLFLWTALCDYYTGRLLWFAWAVWLVSEGVDIVELLTSKPTLSWKSRPDFVSAHKSMAFWVPSVARTTPEALPYLNSSIQSNPSPQFMMPRDSMGIWRCQGSHCVPSCLLFVPQQSWTSALFLGLSHEEKQAAFPRIAVKIISPPQFHYYIFLFSPLHLSSTVSF